MAERVFVLFTIFMIGIAAGAVLRAELRPCTPTVISAPWETSP